MISAERLPTRVDVLAGCIAAAAFGIFSLMLSGFRFDIVNNSFHIPIVLGWTSDPAFRNDLMVQTLGRFASPLYLGIAAVADERSIAGLFLTLMIASRALTFIAIDAIARAFGAPLAQRLAALAVIACGITVYGTSRIGADGLLIPYFSHSELAQAVALFGVACMIRAQLGRAGLLVGLTFAINAFIGLWCLVPLGLLCLDRLVRDRAAWREVFAAAAGFSLLAAPTALWILHAQAAHPYPPFDYAAFLKGYFPFHFFIGASTWDDRMHALAQLVAACLATAMLPRRREFGLVLSGFVLVVVAGIAIGETSTARWLLNLHLMRAGGMLVWLATIATVLAAMSGLWRSTLGTVVAATLVLLGTMTDRWLLVPPALLLLLLATRYVGSGDGDGTLLGRRSRRFALAGAGVVALSALIISTSNCCYGRESGWNGRTVPTDGQLIGSAPGAPFWKQAQRWARAHTPRGAMFLTPPMLDGFRTGARRPLWISWQDGGAVPWAPDLYRPWRTRLAEIARLQDRNALLAYACAHRISFVLTDLRKPPILLDPRQAAWRNRYFAIHDVRPMCPNPPTD